jgi:hypothetical protein
MERAERDGLCDDSNLGLFVRWYAFGGSERGLLLSEIESMSAARIKDWSYLLRETGRILKRNAKKKVTD